MYFGILIIPAFLIASHLNTFLRLRTLKDQLINPENNQQINCCYCRLPHDTSHGHICCSYKSFPTGALPSRLHNCGKDKTKVAQLAC